jgi:hypothetical protein
VTEHSAESDRLTGAEGRPAVIVGEWTIIGVNTPAKWVNVKHSSGRVACLPWSAVVAIPDDTRPNPPGSTGGDV